MNDFQSQVEKKLKQFEIQAKRIVNKGVVNELETTLEAHENILVLLEELHCTLEQDLPEEIVLMKISGIEEVLNSLEKELNQEEAVKQNPYIEEVER